MCRSFRYKPEKSRQVMPRPVLGAIWPSRTGGWRGRWWQHDRLCLVGCANLGIPADFDTEGFITPRPERNYLSLQAAWDVGDLATLRSMMTDEMLSEVRQQLAEREAEADGAANINEIEGLEAQLLGIEDQGDVYLASVEFSGMSREEQGAGLSPFREVWEHGQAQIGQWWLAGGRFRQSPAPEIPAGGPVPQLLDTDNRGLWLHSPPFLALAIWPSDVAQAVDHRPGLFSDPATRGAVLEPHRDARAPGHGAPVGAPNGRHCLGAMAAILDGPGCHPCGSVQSGGRRGRQPDLRLQVTDTNPLAMAQAALRGDEPAIPEGDVQLAADINWLVENS